MEHDHDTKQMARGIVASINPGLDHFFVGGVADDLLKLLDLVAEKHLKARDAATLQMLEQLSEKGI